MEMRRTGDIAAERDLRAALLEGSIEGSLASNISDILKVLDMARGENAALRAECRQYKHDADVANRRLNAKQRKRKQSKMDLVISWAMFFGFTFAAALLASFIGDLIWTTLGFY